MGNCTYLMSEPCNSTDVPHFAVYVDNENRYNILTVSYVSAVHVHVLGVKVSILKGGNVQVRKLLKSQYKIKDVKSGSCRNVVRK